mgnify:CR=1 FL=1
MRVLWLALLLCAGCGGDRFTPGDPVPACDAGTTSQALTLSGESGADERIWALESCTDLGDDVWRQAWRGGTWLIEVQGGPLVAGEVVATDVSVLVQDGDGAVWTSDLATIDVQSYDDGGPCGRWTSNPVRNGSGELMTIAPQPAGFDCTLLQ